MVVGIMAYTIAAVAWGWSMPTLSVHVLPDLTAERVPGTEDAKFVAFGRAVLITSVIAFAVSIWAFATRFRSLLMMLWLGVVTGLGSVWFVIFGNSVARATHPEVPGHPQPGQTIDALVPVGLSTGMLLAPTLALLFYWVASSFIDNQKF